MDFQDRFTIEHSEMLEQGKEFYNAQDLFAQKKCFLTVPTKGTFSAQDARQSQSNASVRIRVEML